MALRVAWGITGSGDRLVESVETMEALRRKHSLEVDVILSKAAVTVVKWYKLWDIIQKNFDKVFVEHTPNTPFLIGPLQLGKYDILLVYPATANTTAKIAHGIADSLLTNCVAQAVKAGIEAYIFPVDQKAGSVETTLPNGRRITLHMRQVDVENAEKLVGMKGITVLTSSSEVETVLLECSEKKSK